jgi:hypothetical protein
MLRAYPVYLVALPRALHRQHAIVRHIAEVCLADRALFRTVIEVTNLS